MRVSCEARTAMPPPVVPSMQGDQQSIRIIFFCKDCEKIVAGIKVGRKYVYKCPACGTKNVAFGTEKSIKSFYHVGE
mgnify:FL=1